MSTKTTYCIANYFFLSMSIIFFTGAFFCAITKCDPPSVSSPLSAQTIQVTKKRDEINTTVFFPVAIIEKKTIDQCKALGLSQDMINRHCFSGELPGKLGSDGNWVVSNDFLKMK